MNLAAVRLRIGHAVPLSNNALALLLGLPRDGEYLFCANARRLGAGTMRQVLRQLGRADVTVHGFRSSFRDWAAEATGHDNFVCELALAHAVGSKVEASYRRGALLEKRRALMDDWASFCASGDNVVALRRTGAVVAETAMVTAS
jgi:integrase